MKKNSVVKHALSIASVFVLAVAAVATSAPCIVCFYQPKTPQNLAARLDAMKDSK